MVAQHAAVAQSPTGGRAGWNLLDVLVVVVSIVNAASADSGGLTSLRAIRALRAVRLLKGVDKLREIVNTVLRSVRGYRMSGGG